MGCNMFAYCNNNPVRNMDASGCFPMATNRFASNFMLCDGSQTGGGLPIDNNTGAGVDKTSVASKLLSSVNLALQSIEVSAGIGQGAYVEFDVLETVGVGIGMYGNYVTLNYADGEFYGGQEMYVGISGTLLWYEFGAAEHLFKDSNGQELTSAFVGLNTQQDSLTLFTVACYPLCAGFSISIGFDTISFFTGLDNIW